MSTTQRHLLSKRDLTYATAHDKCITDEMARKANIAHMRDSANCKAAKVQQVISGCNVEQSSKSPDKCKSCGSMQDRTESCRFRNATCHHCQKRGHIRPSHKAQLSQMKCVGSCDTHARDTPVDATEDVAFGLYRTGMNICLLSL